MNESYTTRFKPGQSSSAVEKQSTVDARQPLQFTYLYTHTFGDGAACTLTDFAPWSKFPVRSMEVAFAVEESTTVRIWVLDVPDLGGRIATSSYSAGETKATYRFYQDKYLTGIPIPARLVNCSGALLAASGPTDIAIRITFFSE